MQLSKKSSLLFQYGPLWPCGLDPLLLYKEIARSTALPLLLCSSSMRVLATSKTLRSPLEAVSDWASFLKAALKFKKPGHHRDSMLALSSNIPTASNMDVWALIVTDSDDGSDDGNSALADE